MMADRCIVVRTVRVHTGTIESWDEYVCFSTQQKKKLEKRSIDIVRIRVRERTRKNSNEKYPSAPGRSLIRVHFLKKERRSYEMRLKCVNGGIDKIVYFLAFNL